MKKFKFTIAGQPYDTTVNEIEPNICEVTVNGTVFHVEIEKQETLKKKPVVAPRPVATGVAATVAKPAAAPAPAPKAVPAAAPAGGTKVTSPLTGSVIKVRVSEGQAVKKGDTLLTLESMKMENAIMAECDGTVSKIAVTAGQNVMQDDILVILN